MQGLRRDGLPARGRSGSRQIRVAIACRRGFTAAWQKPEDSWPGRPERPKAPQFTNILAATPDFATYLGSCAYHSG